MKRYSVIRFPENFPNLGGDLDILCLNLEEIEKFIYKNTPKNYKIKKSIGKRNNIHLDVFEKNIFLIKFSFYHHNI